LLNSKVIKAYAKCPPFFDIGLTIRNAVKGSYFNYSN